jgi:ferritin
MNNSTPNTSNDDLLDVKVITKHHAEIYNLIREKHDAETLNEFLSIFTKEAIKMIKGMASLLKKKA